GESFIIQMLSPDAWAPLLGFTGILLFMFGKERQKGIGQGRGGTAHQVHAGHQDGKAQEDLADALLTLFAEH
ncbi:hypothetical protein H6B10_17970, partial [Gemmiger formicilis]|uniref:hypothetical protein n=1 Tax=Gemmiger formicilis TaxID=745368 RepID=UPI001DC83026|nr:hypothetical protein [Gemmiger formicilis]